MIQLIGLANELSVLNSVIVPLAGLDRAAIVERDGSFFQNVATWLRKNKQGVFKPESRVYGLLESLLKRPFPEGLKLVHLVSSEIDDSRKASRPLGVNALASLTWKEAAELNERLVVMLETAAPEMGRLARRLLDCSARYSKAMPGNREVAAQALFDRAAILAVSPDARVNALMELSDHYGNDNPCESLVCEVTSAGIVAMHLEKAGRMPNFFAPASPREAFGEVCGSVSAEAPEFYEGLRIEGLCTGKYFSEYGILFLLTKGMDRAKRGKLYEYGTRIRCVSSAIAERRGLWNLMERQMVNCAVAWAAISMETSAVDRVLGSYYRVQFRDGKNFVYREAGLTNLWAFSDKMKKSAKLLAPEGLEPVVTNQGVELSEEQRKNGTSFFVLVKSVEPFFAPEERNSRITVFEQSIDIRKFFFDVPCEARKGASATEISTRRYIFEAKERLSFPFISHRMEVDALEFRLLSPLETSCDGLRRQVDRLRDAIQRKDVNALQPLLQGCLMTTVNEGPKAMAEAFLKASHQGADPARQAELRKLFRDFLDSSQKGVALHAELSRIDPQDWKQQLHGELEAGLYKIDSALQPYLS